MKISLLVTSHPTASTQTRQPGASHTMDELSDLIEENQKDVCSLCSQMLGDVYFPISGSDNICKNCAVCSVCEEQIESSLRVQVDKEGNRVLFCSRCYVEKQCSMCDKIIDTMQVTQLSEGVFVHQKCFICAKCENQLAGSYYQNSEKKFICVECYEGSLKSCYACGEKIKDVPGKSVGNKDETRYYHVECMECPRCKNLIRDGDGIKFDEDKQLIHSKCS
ncbi:MAG: hypothetical protein MHMPM18_000971 [Marteilia pararefringens]